MENVKFRGISRKKDEFRGNSAENSAAQIPRENPKFRGSARNSAGRGKLWALQITIIISSVLFQFTLNRNSSFFSLYFSQLKYHWYLIRGTLQKF